MAEGTSPSGGGGPVDTNDLDINGNDLISSGDMIPVLSWTIGPNESTTSSTYQRYGSVQAQFEYVYDSIIPSGAQVQFYGTADVSANGDSVDMRMRDAEQNQVIVESTGLDGNVVFGPVNYTPNTPSSRSRLTWWFRNQDNSTSVSVSRASAVMGIKV